ncbi:MAG: hypothetical protein ACLR7N_12265 [Roseburia hominis]
MAHRYPEVLRTEFNGMKRKFGGRHNSARTVPSPHVFGTAGGEAGGTLQRTMTILWHGISQ